MAHRKVSTPLLSAPRIDLSVEWNALLHGAVVANVVFNEPELTFVEAPGTSNGRSGLGVDWRGVLEGMLPIRMDKVEVRNGCVHFRNFDSTPPVNALFAVCLLAFFGIGHLRFLDSHTVFLEVFYEE